MDPRVEIVALERVAEFDGMYENIEQSNIPAHKEKLEDNLKREIKKPKRLRHPSNKEAALSKVFVLTSKWQYQAYS
ncbi:hypothetical protein F4678DRAFT_456149 [Xylaria arbuscula]|nr:hypothetical protein F4678DRAFT_456149 [Xylaria arbuscula]